MNRLDHWINDHQSIPGSLRTLSSREARNANFSPLDLPQPLAGVLSDKGIENPYHHQAKAVKAVRQGQNTVVATPTASGKSLVYTVIALERALRSNSRTLYIGPQVALINDQTQTLQSFASKLSNRAEKEVSVDAYTGQTARDDRKRIREEKPQVLTTTPDMVHFSMLPYADDKWRWLFRSLDTVVIDEVHEYRGVFGGHVGQILRRLNRVASELGSKPQYITTSATIGNPIEHVSRVTGQPADSFTLIEQDGSKSGPQEWAFWEPPESEDGASFSSHGVSKEFLKQLIRNENQTVVFTRSRQAAERYATKTKQDFFDNDEHFLADSVAAYHGALDATRRTEIEEGLKTGTIKSVWSTNALELGVDIGSLDAVILDGYPGTTMAAHQQAGRAGRGDQTSLVLFVPSEDQLDHYMLNHPKEVLNGNAESATVDPFNPQIYRPHLIAAAAERPLRASETDRYQNLRSVAADLEKNGFLDQLKVNSGWVATQENPQYQMSIRDIGARQIDLIDADDVPEFTLESDIPTPPDADGKSDETDDLDTIASLQYRNAIRDAHPGAIYYHQGSKYEVSKLDLDNDRAYLEKTDDEHYTQPLFDKEVQINEIEKSEPLTQGSEIVVGFADVTVTERLLGYRISYPDGGERQEYQLKLPPSKVGTKAVFLTIQDQSLTQPIEQIGERQNVDSPLRSALHAIEHAMIGLLPLELLIDRNDVGGLSTAGHTQTGLPTIFIYDAHKGGIGIAASAFDRMETILENAEDRIPSCECDAGCPKCIIDSNCGNANDYLDKNLAIKLLDKITAMR